MKQRNNSNPRLIIQKKIDSLMGEPINFFIFLKKIFIKRKFPEKIKKILFLKLDALGDAILSLPVLKEIKEQKKYEILVVCSKENKIVFENQPFVDEIITFPSKKINVDFFKTVLKVLKAKSDICLDTSQSTNLSAIISYLSSKYSIGFKRKKGLRDKVYDSSVELDFNKHMVLNYLELAKRLGIISPRSPRLVSPTFFEEDLLKINELFEKESRYIGVHPCHEIDSREWPGERFAEILSYLIKKGYTPCIFGSPKEIEKTQRILDVLKKDERNNALNLVGKLTLSEVFACMRKLKMFIGNDSGLIHVAASFDLPVIAIFGAETPRRYAPFNQKSLSVWKGETLIKDLKIKTKKIPLSLSQECLKKISVKEVIETINKLESLNNSFI